MIQKEEHKRLSVIICTYNRDDVLGKCLNHLARQEDADFEWVLVNNNSTDTTDALIQTFIDEHPLLDINYFIESNQGLSYARNRGIKEAKNDYLVFLDDDAFAFPDYVKNLKTFLQHYPDAQAGGGKIVALWEKERPHWMSKYLLSLVSTIDLGDNVRLFKGRKYPIGANMIIQRALFDRLGLFDVQLGRKGKNMEGAEEKDFFLRIKKTGVPVYYIPDVVVEHWAPESRLTPDFFSKQALAIGSSERVRAKNISSVEYAKSVMRELFKWAATGVLFAFYTISLRYSQGAKLVVFRWKISKGLFGCA